MGEEKIFEINGSQIYDLGRVIFENGYQSYLEIGLLHGTTLFSMPARRRVGVEPAVSKQFLFNLLEYKEFFYICNDEYPNVKIYAMESDDFFKINKEKFDIVFIDGLHTRDQSLRDVENSLQFLNEGGTIACHDTSPKDKDAAIEYGGPGTIKGFWCGDVYKMIIELRVKRPDLAIWTVPVPNGLTFIKKASEPQDTLKEDYLLYGYDEFDKERDLILNVQNGQHG